MVLPIITVSRKDFEEQSKINELLGSEMEDSLPEKIVDLYFDETKLDSVWWSGEDEDKLHVTINGLEYLCYYDDDVYKVLINILNKNNGRNS